jgi:predicted ArsR family transcriptional regulator
MDVLECLKAHGQCLDLQIAEETGIPLARVRTRLEDLARNGDIIKCSVTRFTRGTPVHSWQCRIAGYAPPRAPGRPGRKPASAG